jgi:hypothetical protein
MSQGNDKGVLSLPPNICAAKNSYPKHDSRIIAGLEQPSESSDAVGSVSLACGHLECPNCAPTDVECVVVRRAYRAVTVIWEPL